MIDAIEEAIQLRKAKKLKESNALLISLHQKDSENAYLNYQIAWSFDVLGEEHQAVHYYEKAIALGLLNPDLEEAYLGLGSTYRTIGEYTKSEQILTTALEQFPTNNALKVFYSMTLFNLKKYSEANRILLELLAQTSSDQKIKDYNKAISFYADKMDQVWK